MSVKRDVTVVVTGCFTDPFELPLLGRLLLLLLLLLLLRTTITTTDASAALVFDACCNADATC